MPVAGTFTDAMFRTLAERAKMSKDRNRETENQSSNRKIVVPSGGMFTNTLSGRM